MYTFHKIFWFRDTTVLNQYQHICCLDIWKIVNSAFEGFTSNSIVFFYISASKITSKYILQTLLHCREVTVIFITSINLIFSQVVMKVSRENTVSPPNPYP